jgi:vancomycin resistance protein VanJ
MPATSKDQPKLALRCRLARFVAGLAFVLIVAVWGTQEVWGESHWLGAMVTYAPPILYLLIPAFALLMAVLCRDLRALLWALVAGGVCLLGPARPVIPSRHAEPPPGGTLRIVTWNIHDQLQRIPEMRSVLEGLDPDIVCLQEANARRFREECWPGADAAQADSLIILTRGKIERHDDIRLERRGHYIRPLLEAEITLDGNPVNVLNIHLYSFQLAAALKNPTREKARKVTQGAIEMRTLQIERVTDWLTSQRTPAFVAGDFNTPPRGRLYGRLTDVATDAFAAAGNGFGWTFPHSHPVIRIDYIWLTSDVKVVHCRPLRAGPSDHLPLVADVVVP